jgi:hypothetical protein
MGIGMRRKSTRYKRILRKRRKKDYIRKVTKRLLNGKMIPHDEWHTYYLGYGNIRYEEA